MKESILEKEFLTVGEVQKYLNLSRSTTYSLVHTKDFPIARFGGNVRVPTKPFLAWVDRNVYIPRKLKEMV